jgi:gamma-aminobutyric acid receptor subunit beta
MIFPPLLQDYTITMYLNQYWKDDRLGFSSNDEVLTLSGDFAEKIWVPDTFFANDKNRSFFLSHVYLTYICT